jgi:hypothetical protein
VFYFNQFLHKFSNLFFKNLILIRFKGIEANYLYVYQTNFILKISHMTVFTFHSDMRPGDIKRQVTTPKKKPIRDMIKSITQHSYFEKNPNK